MTFIHFFFLLFYFFTFMNILLRAVLPSIGFRKIRRNEMK